MRKTLQMQYVKIMAHVVLLVMFMSVNVQEVGQVKIVQKHLRVSLLLL
jgi:hypothetical protein